MYPQGRHNYLAEKSHYQSAFYSILPGKSGSMLATVPGAVMEQAKT